MNQEDDDEEEISVANVFMGAVNNPTCETEFKFEAYVHEFSKSLRFIVDTGADITCISKDCIPKEQKNRILKTEKIVSGLNGKKLPVIGYLHVKLLRRKLNVQAKVYIIQRLRQNLWANRKSGNST